MVASNAAWLHQGERHSRIRTPFLLATLPHGTGQPDPARRMGAGPRQTNRCPTPPPRSLLRGPFGERGSSTTAPGRGRQVEAAPQQFGAALPATRVSVLVARQGANKMRWVASSITAHHTLQARGADHDRGALEPEEKSKVDLGKVNATLGAPPGREGQEMSPRSGRTPLLLLLLPLPRLDDTYNVR
jgi:hypothetical protein